MSLKYNLQFFAADGPGGEKTEPATEKKLSDARKEGQVAKSREVGNALGLLGMFAILKFWVGNMANSLLSLFSQIYDGIPEASMNWSGYLPQKSMLYVYRQILLKVLLIVGPVFAIAFLLAFLGDVVQVKWKVTTKPLQPKFNKLNPISGFKRIFSVNSLMELLKAILKILLIGYVAFRYLKDKWPYLYMLYDISLMQAIQLIWQLVTELGLQVSVVYVVITNPTHYAVAIKYDPMVADAPIVVAKGEDYLARKIKEVAKENSIEIVENKPLARMLYANVDVGAVVPPELYQAVAEVLAFVYHLKGKI